MGPCGYFILLMRTALLIALSAFTAIAADGGFLTVTGPCRISFPADHGPHTDYRTEWWYYTGSLIVDGTRHAVRGSGWMDHEFSTAPLQPGITGWDWFSLQLGDRAEIMIYLLRQSDGTLNPATSGTYVLPSGQKRHLSRGDVRIEPLSHWTSPHSGARYPVEWQVAVVPLNVELTITANLDDQEMRPPNSTNVVYWEGSVQIQGNRNEKAIDGVGGVELTGYARPFDAPM